MTLATCWMCATPRPCPCIAEPAPPWTENRGQSIHAFDADARYDHENRPVPEYDEARRQLDRQRLAEADRPRVYVPGIGIMAARMQAAQRNEDCA